MLRGFSRSAERRAERRLRAIRDVIQSLSGSGASVVLFGSWARGEAAAASDFDILLIAEDRRVRDRLVWALRSSKIPADVHWFTPDEAERLLPYSSILLDALQEGIVLLDEAGISGLLRRARELGRRGVGKVAGGWRLGEPRG